MKKSILASLMIPAVLLGLWACSSSDGKPAPTTDGDTESAETIETDTDTTEHDTEAESEEESAPSCQDTPIEARPTPLQADTTFDLGPYLMHTTTTSAVIMWRTKEAADGKVVWGVGEALDKETAQDGKSTIHEITLTGLSANVRYAYKVVSGGIESAVHHLHAAPAAHQPIRFTAVGDSQGHPDIYSGIIAQMAPFEPFFMLHVGDGVQDPTVSETYDPFKTELFDVIRPLAHELPFYEAIGNHEKESSAFYDLVSYPGLQTPARPTFESFYSFRYGNTFFLVINTNTLLLSVGSLADFIRKEAASEAAQSATWRVAVAHYPGYTDVWSGCNFDGYPLSRDWLLPLLGENKFHVFLSGHAHDYQRGLSNKVLTVVTGGGGGGLDTFCKAWDDIQVVKYLHHHVQIEAGCKTMKIRAIDTDGHEIDHVTLDAAKYGDLADAGPTDVETDGPASSEKTLR